MTTYPYYNPWEAHCRSLLENHHELEALCICDHENHILGAAYTRLEFENLSTVESYQVKPLVMLLGAAKPGKSSVYFLGDHYLVVHTDKESIAAKSGRKSLFLRTTSSLHIIGLNMESDGQGKHDGGKDAMCAIHDYFEAADF
ncbi:hypothetical protein T265_05506 [Opisthorchis viverrini]|uniref:Profilin n=2 Tax=Opisthorchis viverrini TaxID=6198 RepID=A0A074ZVS1_OPIVI|nr:hypothetical protein T265_05506 [Opisthorchis viverrini]KER27475.1 hypothetical protein T265_05506 [Opisthorchis viverrini]